MSDSISLRKRINHDSGLRKRGRERTPTRSISRPPAFRGLVFGVSLALVCGISLFAHLWIYVSGQDDYVGPLSALDRLFDLIFAAFLLALAFSLGRTICARMSVSLAGIAEEFAFCTFIGAGTLALAVLGLGLAGILKPLPVAALGLLLIAAAFRQASRLVRLSREAWQEATRTRHRKLAAMLLAAMALVMVLRAATPPYSFDEAIYHLAITKSFVARGRIFPVVDNWAGNMPFLVQMLYAICLLAKADIAAKVFSCFLAFTCAAAVYGFCARFIDRHTGIVALFVFFAAGMVVEVSVTARIDVSLAAVLFLSAYAMIVHLDTKCRSWLILSAMMSGFALGIKYSAGIWIALLGAMFVFESLRPGLKSLPQVIKHGGLFAVIAGILCLPWFGKNLVWFHNPVYPFVTGEVAVLGPGTVRYFGPEDERRAESYFDLAQERNPGLVVERSSSLAEQAAHRVERHPWRFWEYFTKPDDYNMAEDYHYPNYLFLSAPLLLLLPGSRWLTWLLILSVFFFLSATWSSWVGRILLPVYPPLTVISAYVLTRLGSLTQWRFQRRDSRSAPKPSWKAAAIPISAALAVVVLLSVSQFAKYRELEFIFGGKSRRDFMRQMFFYPPIDFINNELPQDSGVLMIGAQMSYDIQRDCIPDVDWDSTEWRRLLSSNNSLSELSQSLKNRGITHILYTDSLYKWAALMGRRNYPVVSGIQLPAGQPDYYTQLVNWATFDMYSASYLELVYSDKMGYLVYKIK